MRFRYLMDNDHLGMTRSWLLANLSSNKDSTWRYTKLCSFTFHAYKWVVHCELSLSEKDGCVRLARVEANLSHIRFLGRVNVFA
jgi:hypothetical protein